MATGCRLDGGVIEAIAAEVEARMAGADLLIVNKFGKLEAQGRGLCPAIAMAIEMEIPTLVGVNQVNVPELNTFSDGPALDISGCSICKQPPKFLRRLFLSCNCRLEPDQRMIQGSLLSRQNAPIFFHRLLRNVPAACRIR